MFSIEILDICFAKCIFCMFTEIRCISRYFSVNIAANFFDPFSTASAVAALV